MLLIFVPMSGALTFLQCPHLYASGSWQQQL